MPICLIEVFGTDDLDRTFVFLTNVGLKASDFFKTFKVNT